MKKGTFSGVKSKQRVKSNIPNENDDDDDSKNIALVARNDQFIDSQVDTRYLL